MSTDAVVLSLKALKLHGMAGAVAELSEQGAPAYHQSTGLLNQLIKAEVADREVRSINYQMKVAAFWRIATYPVFHLLTVQRTKHWSGLCIAASSWIRPRISY